MAATAAMAAAPYDGFNHAAILNNDDALITYCGQECQRAKGRQECLKAKGPW